MRQHSDIRRVGRLRSTSGNRLGDSNEGIGSVAAVEEVEGNEEGACLDNSRRSSG